MLNRLWYIDQVKLLFKLKLYDLNEIQITFWLVCEVDKTIPTHVLQAQSALKSLENQNTSKILVHAYTNGSS